VTATGVYVYGVAAGDAPVPQGAGALDVRFPLRTVREDGLAAIVSEVPLDEFGEDAIGGRLGDREWVEAKVRAHEDVLERALEAGVVPFRFGTVFRGEEPVRELLRERAELLRVSLRRVADKREWGVKVLVDDDELASWTAATDERAGELADEAEAASAGRAYLARKRLEQVVREEGGERAAAWAREVHDRLAAQAAEARTVAIPPAELSGYALPIALNGAYLVTRDGEDAFAAAVEECRRDFAGRGLELAVSGPWPPYNFVGEDEA
jgi:hypothetical protein